MSVHPFRFRASYGNTAGVFRVEPSQTRLWVPDMTVCAMLSEPREPVSVRPGSLHSGILLGHSTRRKAFGISRQATPEGDVPTGTHPIHQALHAFHSRDVALAGRVI